jgi:hypothetical protein
MGALPKRPSARPPPTLSPRNRALGKKHRERVIILAHIDACLPIYVAQSTPDAGTVRSMRGPPKKPKMKGGPPPKKKLLPGSTRKTDRPVASRGPPPKPSAASKTPTSRPAYATLNIADMRSQMPYLLLLSLSLLLLYD